MASGCISKAMLFMMIMNGAMALYCDPQSEYYKPLTDDCGHCRPCMKGKGREIHDHETRIGIKGAFHCLPCENCRRGTYSDRRSHSCSVCTDCGKLHMKELRPCSPKRDAKCTLSEDDLNDGLRKDKDLDEISTGRMILFVVGCLTLVAVVVLVTYYYRETICPQWYSELQTNLMTEKE